MLKICYDFWNRIINKNIVYLCGLIWSLLTFGFHIKEEHSWTLTSYMKFRRSQQFLSKTIKSSSFMEPKVNSRVHKSPSVHVYLTHMNPVYTHKPHFCKISCNISSALCVNKSHKQFNFLFSIFNQNTAFVHNACYTLNPSPNIWWSLQIMKLLLMQFSPSCCHFLPSEVWIFSNSGCRLRTWCSLWDSCHAWGCY